MTAWAGARLHRGDRRGPAQEQRQRRHGQHAEDGQTEIGGAPAGAVDEVLHHRRPHRAGQVVAAHADGHRDAPAAGEPQRGVGHQRREGGGDAEQADQQSVGQCELPQAARSTRGRKSQPQAGSADQRYHHHAEAVGQPPHEDAADAKADQRQGVGKRGIGAHRAEIALHGRQHHRRTVHADATDGHQRQRHHQARPGVGGFDAVAGACSRVHGAAPVMLLVTWPAFDVHGVTRDAVI
jgi:hypothetical protein